MTAKGIMEQIRGHLSQGMTSREIIDLGYAAGSVYKVQRELSRAKDMETIKGVGEKIREGLEPNDRVSAVRNRQEKGAFSELFDLDDESDEEVERPEFPQRELELLRERVERVEEQSQSLNKATAEVQELAKGIKNFELQVEELTQTQAAQDKQIANWEERWDQLTQLINAICTQIHCTREALIDTNPPQGLERLSSQAMEEIRKRSQYAGEKARSDQLDEIISKWVRR